MSVDQVSHVTYKIICLKTKQKIICHEFRKRKKIKQEKQEQLIEVFNKLRSKSLIL